MAESDVDEKQKQLLAFVGLGVKASYSVFTAKHLSAYFTVSAIPLLNPNYVNVTTSVCLFSG